MIKILLFLLLAGLYVAGFVLTDNYKIEGKITDASHGCWALTTLVFLVITAALFEENAKKIASKAKIIDFESEEEIK